jgi:hypothetical protein
LALTQLMPHCRLTRLSTQIKVYIIMFEEQLHWLQCTLSINLYLEKFYIIIWFWLWFVLIATVYSIIVHLVSFTKNRKFFIQSRLECKHKTNNGGACSTCADDAKKILSETNLDTLLVLNLVHANTSEFFLSAIINELNRLIQYDDYKQES